MVISQSNGDVLFVKTHSYSDGGCTPNYGGITKKDNYCNTVCSFARHNCNITVTVASVQYMLATTDLYCCTIKLCEITITLQTKYNVDREIFTVKIFSLLAIMKKLNTSNLTMLYHLCR